MSGLLTEYLPILVFLGVAFGLARLLDHMMARKDVWICRRIDIARHWAATHPYPGSGLNEQA